MSNAKHPMQPVMIENGIAVFRENKIVRDELGSLRTCDLDDEGYSDEDILQFMQLVGYSVRDFCESRRPSEADKRAAQEAVDALLGSTSTPSANTPKPDAWEYTTADSGGRDSLGRDRWEAYAVAVLDDGRGGQYVEHHLKRRVQR